jgi:hypothetical protein
VFNFFRHFWKIDGYCSDGIAFSSKIINTEWRLALLLLRFEEEIKVGKFRVQSRIYALISRLVRSGNEEKTSQEDLHT